jgi:membrane fusion protein (multidrug efflux system)
VKKLVGIILFLGISAGLIWLVWFLPVKAPEEEKKPEAEVTVHVGKISRATLRAYVTAYGTVEADPKASARVAVAVPGVIAVVNCVEGQRVEKDALLFALDSRIADVAVKFAEKTLERQQTLAKIEGTSQKNLQDAEQQLASARAQLALLQIQAPIAGTVTKVNVKAGEAADLTTVLAELVDLERLVVNFNAAGGELAALKTGQTAELTIPESTNVVNASLTFVSPQVDAKTGSGMARAALPANSGARAGQFVKVRVVTDERKDRLVVPAASVAKDPTGATFIAVVEGDKAALKPVKAGLRDGELLEIEGDGVDTAKVPRVMEHRARMLARPAVQKAVAAEGTQIP